MRITRLCCLTGGSPGRHGAGRAVGDNEAAGREQGPDLLDRPADVRRADVVDHGQGGLGQAGTQVGQRDHQPVAEGEFVLRSCPCPTATDVSATVVTPTLAPRFPPRFELVEQLTEVLAAHAAEGRMRQGRAGPSIAGELVTESGRKCINSARTDLRPSGRIEAPGRGRALRCRQQRGFAARARGPACDQA